MTTPMKDTDLGTPEVADHSVVELKIDGRQVSVPAGTSILRAAQSIGAAIPKLCATDSLQAFGSCRLCLVEIEGRPGAPASCTTPVAAGMVIHTQTPQLKTLRRGVMELYISDHPLDCLTCAANGDCELQDMAGAVGFARSAMGVRLITTSICRATSRTPTSRSTPPSASSVRGASERAMRFRERSR